MVKTNETVGSMEETTVGDGEHGPTDVNSVETQDLPDTQQISRANLDRLSFVAQQDRYSIRHNNNFAILPVPAAEFDVNNNTQ